MGVEQSGDLVLEFVVLILVGSSGTKDDIHLISTIGPFAGFEII